MTDETKKLFDAPWTYSPEHSLICAKGLGSILKILNTRVAKRVQYMPELYDALMEAKRSFCAVDYEKDCSKFCHYFNERKECKALKWAELLRKVRDGK